MMYWRRYGLYWHRGPDTADGHSGSSPTYLSLGDLLQIYYTDLSIF
jgi:hypothetical protein